MSSANSRNNWLLMMGKILILAIIVAAVFRSYFMTTKADFADLYVFVFILMGAVALIMISFTGAEIRRALRYLAGTPGTDVEIRHSALLWEAAARGCWMLGGLGSVLNLTIGFIGMKTSESAGVGSIIDQLSRCLLSTFYGTLLAVLCLMPYWKVMGKLQSQAPLPNAGRDDTAVPTRRFGRNFVTAIGYVLFLSILALVPFHFSIPRLWGVMSETAHSPALLLVVGGTLVLMMFSGEANSGLTISTSFAAMGLLGTLMGCIQVLFGISSFSRSGHPTGIGDVAGGAVFILLSCFVALAGMILVGAPLADRAIRIGRITAPSAFSRLSWYGFPFLTLILAPLVVVLITTPLPKPAHRLTEVSAPFEEQKARYEPRAPQSEPMNFLRANIQERNLIYKVNPAYPEQAKREGIQGTVKLRIIINEEGFVYEAKGNPGNNPVLEQAAISAVKRWRFSPFIIKDVPVAIETMATVNFALK